MSKPKVADLSSGLVELKGRAAPPPDAPTRAPALPPADERRRQGATEDAGAAREEIVPLNFRIPASLRRAFKTYAAQHDMKLNELLKVAFEAYRAQHGD